jgi:hypothetical protein
MARTMLEASLPLLLELPLLKLTSKTPGKFSVEDQYQSGSKFPILPYGPPFPKVL